jgi:hypothetical protein
MANCWIDNFELKKGAQHRPILPPAFFVSNNAGFGVFF